jgi:hypothetical protein
MDTARLVFGLHLFIGALFLLFGVFAGLNGNTAQLIALSSMAVMIGLLGRYAGRAAARR